jgi:NTP pyrophosphatase (non-canonical NTP hydrolase)
MTATVDYLNEIARECCQTSREHGFWDHEHLSGTFDVDGQEVAWGTDNPSIWAEKIALMHSEASEMLEALRDGDEPQLAEECADLLIRLFDFTHKRGIDIQMAVERKMAKNKGRPRMHGRKF